MNAAVVVGVAGVVFAYAAFRFVAIAGVSINAAAFSMQIEKLARAQNLDRARKLCMAAPKATLTAVTRAILGAAHMVSAGDGEGRIAQVLSDAGMAEASRQAGQLNRAALGDLPAALLAVGAGAWAVEHFGKAGTPYIAFAAFDVLMIGFLMMRTRSLVADAVGAVHGIASAVASAVAGGATISAAD